MKVQKAKTILRQWEEFEIKSRSDNLVERLRAEKQLARLAASLNEARQVMESYDVRVEQPRREMVNKLVTMMQKHQNQGLVKFNRDIEEMARHILNIKGMEECQKILDQDGKIEIYIPTPEDVERIAR